MWWPPSQLFKTSSPRTPFRESYPLGGRIGVHQQHHLYDKLSFDFKIPLKLELAIMLAGEPTFFTKLLWVILIALPSSTEQSTLAQSYIHFATELPSLLQDLWYPTCLLDLKNPKILKTQVNLAIPPILSPFRGLFIDYRPPLLPPASWFPYINLSKNFHLYSDDLKSFKLFSLFCGAGSKSVLPHGLKNN